MKKTTKSFLVSALILFCAGLLLALCSALFVTINGIDPYGVTQNPKIIENKTISLSEILSVSPESSYMKKLSTREFLRIDLRSYAGDLIVRSANETSLELINTNTSNLSYEIKGETLTIKEIDPVGFMGIYIDDEGFSFKGLRHIFGPGNSANSGKTIILNLAEDFQIDQIDISSNIGDVALEGISCGIINTKISLGNISINNLNLPDAKIDISGDISNITITDSIYGSCNVSTKIGNLDVDVPNSTKQSTVLDSWIGNIQVNADVPLSEFKLILSTSLGNVYENNKIVGKELRDSSNNPSRISSTLFFGDIYITSTSNGSQTTNSTPDSEETETDDLISPSDENQAVDITESNTTDSENSSV